MKVTEGTKGKCKLTRLQLIKAKAYKEIFGRTHKISDIMAKLKKSLNIIYKFHTNNKRILFLGTPTSLNKKWLKLVLKKKTKHVLLPESAWQSGLLSNMFAKFYDTHKKSTSSNFTLILRSFVAPFDLIVLIDLSKKNSALHEAYLSKIPVISLGSSSLSIFDFKTSYKIPGNYRLAKKKTGENLFYSILIATLKKKSKKPVKGSLTTTSTLRKKNKQ